MSAGAPAPRSRALAVGKLVRLSLLPSALADAVCGVALGGVFAAAVDGAGVAAGDAEFDAWPGPIVLLALLVSACLFHGGMALNDWADRAEDARLERDRPLPNGDLSPSFALGLAVSLFAIGVAAAASVSWRGAVAAASVAACAAAYDLVGRGPLRGPLLLALCRAGNLATAAWIGASATGAELRFDRLVPIALAYALYVFTLSRLGRMEDDETREPGGRPRPILVVLAVLLASAPVVAFASVVLGGAATPDTLHWVAFLVGAGLAWHGARPLLVEARARSTWSRGEVMRAMGLVLRRLALFTCTVTFGLGEPLLGAAILLAYPLGARLRKVFPPS